MNRTWIVLIILAAGLISFYYAVRPTTSPTNTPINVNVLPTPMTITSSAFKPNGAIPAEYTCDGAKISPPLAFADIPPQAKSLALIMDDPDAPKAGGFVHWLIWNMPPTTKAIAANIPPTTAVFGQNDAGKNSYASPCPPSGTHQYIFTLYAVDTVLQLPAGSTRAQLLQALRNHTLGKDQLTGTYARRK